MKRFIMVSFLLCPMVVMAQVPNPALQQKSIPYDCKPAYTLPADIEVKDIGPDQDGDRWVTVTTINNGRIQIGFATKDGGFCSLQIDIRIGPRT